MNNELSNADFQREEEWARSQIPAHLDAVQLIANSWDNTVDAQGRQAIIDSFRATVELYIDQDCSAF